MQLRKTYLIVLLCCLTLIAVGFTYNAEKTAAAPQSYFVSPQGSDTNPGTADYPWRTIQKAADTVQPGDTVFIRGGTYRERVSLKTSGTPDAYITFINYGDEIPVIDGEGIDWYSPYEPWGCLLNFSESTSYVNIIGLRVINSKWAGIGAQSTSGGNQHIRVQNCSTYNTISSGIAFFRANGIIVEGNQVEQACTGTDSVQECISIATVDFFEVKNNQVFNCTNSIPGAGGEGIDVKNGCNYGIIQGNTVENVAKIGIYIDAYSQAQTEIEVLDNLVFNCGEGIAVATENGGVLQNVIIRNNRIYDINNGFGFSFGWESDDNSHAINQITLKENYFKNMNSDNGSILIANSEAANISIINNVLDYNGESIVASHWQPEEFCISGNIPSNDVLDLD